MRTPKQHRYLGTDDKPRIEILPMIDVMMFLMVFFVLIMMEMIQGTGIPMDLPQADSATSLGKRTVTVGVKQDGSFYLDGQVTTDADLSARLSQLPNAPSANIIIAGDKATPYQHIVRAMDLARGAGIHNIGMATSH